MSIARSSTSDRTNLSAKKKSKICPMHTFDRIEWLKKRVPSQLLIDRTVKLKYLVHPAEMNEHSAIKKVFERFDDNGDRIYFP